MLLWNQPKPQTEHLQNHKKRKGKNEKLPIQASFQYKSVESIFIIIFKFYGTGWQDTNKSETEAADSQLQLFLALPPRTESQWAVCI